MFYSIFTISESRNLNISAVSESINCTISTISGSRNFMVHIHNFLIQKLQYFCGFWIQKPHHFCNFWNIIVKLFNSPVRWNLSFMDKNSCYLLALVNAAFFQNYLPREVAGAILPPPFIIKYFNLVFSAV